MGGLSVRDKRRVHDISLVDSCDTLPVVCLRIVKCVSRDSFRGVPCDQLDRLHDTVYDLK